MYAGRSTWRSGSTGSTPPAPGLVLSHTRTLQANTGKYRFLPEYEGSTLESTPERRRREGADEQSTPEYERYGTDLSRAVRFTCQLKYYTSKYGNI